MCALLASTSRAQAYVFKMDRAKIRPLLPLRHGSQAALPAQNSGRLRARARAAHAR